MLFPPHAIAYATAGGIESTITQTEETTSPTETKPAEEPSTVENIEQTRYSVENLQCEIKNENGDILYKSSVIRPGEYLERLQPQTELANEAMKIELNVYAFAPETWYSKGTINLQNILQPY